MTLINWQNKIAKRLKPSEGQPSVIYMPGQHTSDSAGTVLAYAPSPSLSINRIFFNSQKHPH